MNELSKEISYALRHAPWEYELEMDENGYVSVFQLIETLKNIPKWKDIKYEDLVEMILLSDKKRHEIVNDKIRALYGHSFNMKIQNCEQKPPEILYHGTTNRFLSSIMEKGLLPQARQYVHLSSDVEIAIQVGKRRDENPIILTINSLKAYDNGIKFYCGNDRVWLADKIPPSFIKEDYMNIV